jgi:hypothetical protein
MFHLFLEHNTLDQCSIWVVSWHVLTWGLGPCHRPIAALHWHVISASLNLQVITSEPSHCAGVQVSCCRLDDHDDESLNAQLDGRPGHRPPGPGPAFEWPGPAFEWPAGGRPRRAGSHGHAPARPGPTVPSQACCAGPS